MRTVFEVPERMGRSVSVRVGLERAVLRFDNGLYPKEIVIRGLPVSLLGAIEAVLSGKPYARFDLGPNVYEKHPEIEGVIQPDSEKDDFFDLRVAKYFDPNDFLMSVRGTELEALAKTLKDLCTM